jgi:hypothetical protein
VADDELHLTRRSVFQIITAFLATVSFTGRAPLVAQETNDVLDADIIEENRQPLVAAGHDRRTKLELYLRHHGIKPAHLARESGYSRMHLLRIRMGRMQPSARCMDAITTACQRLAREPVRVADLFDVSLLRRLFPRPAPRPTHVRTRQGDAR